MDIWFVVMELVMLLGGAFLMGAMAQRMGQSPIMGYLLAGIIVGPLLFKIYNIDSYFQKSQADLNFYFLLKNQI